MGPMGPPGPMMMPGPEMMFPGVGPMVGPGPMMPMVGPGPMMPSVGFSINHRDTMYEDTKLVSDDFASRVRNQSKMTYE